MSILLDRNSRILVHGAQSRAARFQLVEMARYRGSVVGVAAGKGIRLDSSLPADLAQFDDVTRAIVGTKADLLLVFSPQLDVKPVVGEAIEAGIRTVVCVTDDIPVHDALELRERARRAGVMLLGPNSTGLLSPGRAKAGYYSEDVCIPGRIGVISKSGSVAYAVMSEMMSAGIGVSTIAGIGGDAVRGASFAELLPLYEADPDTDAIVMLGEIGGDDEERAARSIPGRIGKPVVAFIAGRTVAAGQSLGHAGAIARKGRGDYDSKTKVLADAGVHIAATIGEVVTILKRIQKG